MWTYTQIGLGPLRWSVLASAFAAGLAWGQPATAFGRYHLDVWRAQDGVRLAFTSNLVQTRDGYLWLSTQSGLARFDGVRFTVFDGTNTPALRGRPRLQTYPLLQDSAGSLWIGSDVGLLAFVAGRLETAAIDTAFATDQVNAATVDGAGTVWGVTRSGRVIRATAAGGVHTVRGTRVSYSGSGIAVDATGHVWIGAGEHALYRVHHDSLSPVALPAGLENDRVDRVCTSADSTVWLATTTAILQWRHGEFRRIRLPWRPEFGAVSALAVGPDGVVWVGTHGLGLFRYDGTRFTSVTQRDGLSDDRVIDILIDRDHKVWVATRDGLNRLRPVPFRELTEAAGVPTALPGAMLRDASGTIWLGPPTGGLFRGRVIGDHATFVQAEPVSQSDRLLTLAHARNGGIWVGRLNGSVTRFTRAAHDPPALVHLAPVTDVLEDRDGSLWVGTWHGLYRLHTGTTRLFTAVDGLRDNNIHRIQQDAHGTIWVASQEGIARYDGNHFSLQSMPAGSASRTITLFEAPAGALWLGSAEGLARVTGGRTAFLTVANGLPENWIGAGEMDDAGHVWLGQLHGLTRVDLAELGAIADGRSPLLRTSATFEALDGLPGGDPASWPHPWSFRDSSGMLWFAMGHGIVSVDPAQLAPRERAPEMHIEETALDGTVGSPATALTLGPSVRRLDIRYTGVDLSNGPVVRFRYRLDGFDTTWVEVGTQRVASYTRLPAGRYRFRVTGRDLQSDWNPTEASIDVVVLPPLYRRAWFVLAVCGTVALILWNMHATVVRARTDATRDERSRLAREIHDSLLQGFSGISMRLQAASDRLRLPAPQQALLESRRAARV